MSAIAETKGTGVGHTPGPWVEFADKGETIAIMAAGRDDDVCNFCKPYPSREDARLFAAAPDLLEALITALPYIEYAEEDDAYKPGVVAKVTAQIRAALSKAEGRTT